MNYLKIQNFDTGNAKGLSLIIWVCGCTHFCEECFNQEAWNFKAGHKLTDKKLIEITNALNNSHIKNLIISGGDPLHPKNLYGTLQIIKNTEKIRTALQQNLIIYTGYTLNQLTQRIGEDGKLTSLILNSLTYLIDGRYNKEQKTKKLDYRGSYNQRCWCHNGKEWKDYSNTYFKEKVNYGN